MKHIPKAYLIVGAYILAAALAMFIRSEAFVNYFVNHKIFFDTEHYYRIATSGYDDPALAAFYPLWPLFLRVLSFFTTSLSTTLIIGGLFALVLFLLTLNPLFKILKHYGTESFAWFWVAVYALNPNSFFHAIAYTESLFSLLFVGYIWNTKKFFENKETSTLVRVLIFSLLMSLTRPVLPTLFACLLGCLVTSVISQGRSSLPSLMKHGTASLGGAIAGYTAFGVFCLNRYGDFWQPFQAQQSWNRVLGLHWSVIHSPKSVGGSDNVLTWDFQAFWIPITLVIVSSGILFSKNLQSKSQFKHLTDDYIFWFCLFFAFCHSMIAFLSYDIFMSLGRHVFGIPAIFIAMAMFSRLFRQSRIKTFVLNFYLFTSFIYLAMWWGRFAKGSWAG